MANWCSTAYAIEGDAKEIKSLYELMKGLQERKEPSVENGFGTKWLGCLVDALGKDWNEVSCRGEWANLEMNGDTLRFTTETAWAPCNEVFDLACQFFPSLHYYYQAEEPGCAIYETNDSEGAYFSDKYLVDLCTADNQYYFEYFQDSKTMLEWLGEIVGKPVQSMQEVQALCEEWQKENSDSYCRIDEFVVVG
mgnify:CR=1 FL=1